MAMYLTLDIGNTRIKYVYWSKEYAVEERGEVSELHEIPALMQHAEYIAYCNVRGMEMPVPQEKKDVVFEINPTAKLPFNSLYKTPSTLGKDRIAAIAGASYLYPNKNVLVADAGTCLKLDMLDKEGQYHGGSISPGLYMRYKALNHYTGKLPEVQHREWNMAWGQSTEESILCGVQHGYAAEFNGRVEEFAEKWTDLMVVITGGDADFLGKTSKMKIFAEPILVHYGLLNCLILNEF